MATKNEVMKLALDAIDSKSTGHFSAREMNDGIREGLIELNGGSDKLNIKNFYRGSELFAFVEELIPRISNEGLKDNDFFTKYVDSRNLADGDAQTFWIPDNSLFLVGNAAEGSQSVRRQRISKGTEVTVPVNVHMTKIYDELRRIMAGKVDFTDMVARVGESIAQDKLNTMYETFAGVTAATAGLSSTYVKSGSYSEDALIELVEHVEAATGKSAIVTGTKAALRKVTIGTDTNGEAAKGDRYALGYYGSIAGTPMIQIKQAHRIGTDNFIFDDGKIYVFASDDKFVKFVTEGEGLLIAKDATENADLTQEYVAAERYGAALAIADKFGIYTF